MPVPYTILVGEPVRAHAAKKFDGRKGWVITHNLGEIGVSFRAGAEFNPNDRTEAWFLPSELSRSGG